MKDDELLSLARLRERAFQCREIARAADSRGIAAELEGLAHDYERAAALLEASGRTA